MTESSSAVFIQLQRNDSHPVDDDRPVIVHLRRNENSTPWGFRMQGGKEQGTCLYIQKVNPRSLSEKAGLRAGDGILKIGDVPGTYLSHDQAKMEILRAGNDLDLWVKRNAVSLGIDRSNENVRSRSTVTEESTSFKGFNPGVQSRSFKILQQSLNYAEASDMGEAS